MSNRIASLGEKVGRYVENNTLFYPLRIISSINTSFRTIFLAKTPCSPTSNPPPLIRLGCKPPPLQPVVLV